MRNSIDRMSVFQNSINSVKMEGKREKQYLVIVNRHSPMAAVHNWFAGDSEETESDAVQQLATTSVLTAKEI